MINQNTIISNISKVTIIGTSIVFATNIIFLIIGYIFTKGKNQPETFGLITIILGIIALTEIGCGLFIKRKLLEPLFKAGKTPDENVLRQISLKTTIVLSAICSAIPLYGLVAVIIESNMNAMVGFAIASLAGFMLLRLRRRDFDRLNLS